MGRAFESSVAGIAMGLVVEDDKKYSILTNIAGRGRSLRAIMDFKVAGTRVTVITCAADGHQVIWRRIPLDARSFGEAKKGVCRFLDTWRRRSVRARQDS